MVGPYASLDEAERVQRRLTRSGFRGARIFVDETLRNAPRNEVEATVAEGNPNVLLIGAPDRLSLVFELPLEPRQVRSRRAENVLDIDVGPMATQGDRAAVECARRRASDRACVDRRRAGLGDR